MLCSLNFESVDSDTIDWGLYKPVRDEKFIDEYAEIFPNMSRKEVKEFVELMDDFSF